MPTAHAEVSTDRASRYLVQLCRHFGNKGRHLGRGPRMHGHPGAVAVTEAEAASMRVEWTEEAGDVDFGWARCTLRATPTALVLHAEAEDGAGLTRATDVITAHLARYSRREPLAVAWERSSPAGEEGNGQQEHGTGHGTEQGEAHGVPAQHKGFGRDGHGPGGERGRWRAGALAAVVVVAVAAHLGLFGWLVASSRWTVAAAVGVAAILVVKAGAVAAVAVRRSRTARGGGSR